ncbi:MAG TPA: LptF/LptG family permease [bacterium]|nr:MAG: Lipopolysaccharide export system permease protein LptF [bacterium ADurb.Bin236]HPI75126.1 LptF/LptG family permease [bacterium]HPN94290.1 LptF/LptG family permease [bacterium]
MRLFKTVDRYLMSEFFTFFTFGVSLIILFLMVNTVLFEMMDFVIEKQVPFKIFIRILFYQLPAFAVLAFPMATLFATLLGMSRMSKDSEIDVMRTSGISVFRLMAPLLLMGALVSGAGFLMLQKLVPWSNNHSISLWREFLVSDVSGKPMENVFFKGKGNKHFIINKIDPAAGTLEGVTVYETGDGPHPRAITAPVGKWTKKDMKLFDGSIHNYDSAGHLEYQIDFEELSLNIEREMDEIFGEQRSPQEMSITELKDKIALYKESGIDTRQFETDLHFKTAVPAASFILVLVGAPLSIRAGRSGMMAGVAVTAALVLLYWVGTIVSTMLGKKGVLPPVVAAWSLNFIFLAVGIILVSRTRK